MIMALVPKTFMEGSPGEPGKTGCQRAREPDLNDVFEEDILQITDKDEDLRSYKIFTKNFNGKCFIKTKFHYRFLDRISEARSTPVQKLIFVGIQGIGKSSSAMYYVLSCRKKGDHGIHYVDLNAVKAIDKNLEKFKHYADCVTNDCLVVDHVTLFNMPLVEKIEEVTEYSQIILIETGFTASAHPTSLDFNKDLQLDLVDFKKIWNGSLLLRKKDSPVYYNLRKNCHRVYHELKKELIVTPRLLHRTLNDMILRSYEIEDVLYSAKLKLREEIANFNINVKNPRYESFILDTKTLLELMKYDDEGFTTTFDTLQEFKIAINIFDVQRNRVTEQALKENYRLLELELEEGDSYYVISELIPCLHRFWIEKFPFKCEDIQDQENANKILHRIILNGGFHRDCCVAIVKFQEKNNLVIIPDDYVFLDTNSFEISGKCAIEQCTGVIKERNPLHCFKPDTDELKNYTDDNTDKYDIPLRNVHRIALFLIKKINESRDESLLVYPSVQNLTGFDYFFYTETSKSHFGSGDESNSSLPLKRRRNEGTLFLVQVATGFSHSGITMHKALEVFKKTIKEVTLHVVVLIATKRNGPYTLTGNCGFKNLSVVNIGKEYYSKYLEAFLEKEDYMVIDAIISTSKLK